MGIHGAPLALLRLLEARAELDKVGAEGKTAREYMDHAVPVALATETRKRPSVTKLIDERRAHPGAGACHVDDAFTEDFLCRLEKLFTLLPVAERQRLAHQIEAIIVILKAGSSANFTKLFERQASRFL